MPIQSRPAVRVRVPAKVNLHLSVGSPRADGFHELVTVFQAIGLTDEIDARPADRLSLTVEGEGAGELPTDAGNLAWRAAELLASTADIPPRVALALRKVIPVAGGMAGGSADAAATLLACSTLWDLDAGVTELTGLAGRLGSDVAFPLLGGTALGTGRGEILTPLGCPTPLNWVFAFADHGIAAGDAYRELDRLRELGAVSAAGPVDRLVAALANGNVTAIAGALANDLQPAALALRPELQTTLDAGIRLGALAGIISGSGPTCAFLCESGAAADDLALALAGHDCCRTAVATAGPVAGARVIS